MTDQAKNTPPETARPFPQNAEAESSDLGHERQVYTLRESAELTPEVIAVAFAKCSRSPDSFRKIASEITAEKSAEFHEKWVVGYGHASVAEHATLHVAFENVSTVATKIIEDCRLASYTEKSTRYQVYDRNRYYKPRAIMESRFGDAYVKTMGALFDAYLAFLPVMTEHMEKKYPKAPEMKDSLYRSVTKARACDVIRYLLPAATLTNFGMTANARIFEWAITKFFSHPLHEMQEIAAELKRTTLEVTPTLVKYADPNAYLQETPPALAELHREFTKDFPQIDPVRGRLPDTVGTATTAMGRSASNGIDPQEPVRIV
ncbi:MAG: FAD-dependent thymidylate synthase, partial [Patescibacteria group bacterium]